jgi:CBS domain containing-hemolysin-like protein
VEHPVSPALDLVLVLLLILANGVFSMAEFALVSARKALLRTRAEEGDRGAKAALELGEDPNRFLSTVQVGITLIGILAGAFGGITLAAYLEPFFLGIPALAPWAGGLSIAIVVFGITFVTMVLGELVPKRFSLGPFPGEGEGYYRTLAGFIVSSLWHIPEPGEHTTWNGYRFEVMDMDGKRVDKVLLVPLADQRGS